MDKLNRLNIRSNKKGYERLVIPDARPTDPPLPYVAQFTVTQTSNRQSEALPQVITGKGTKYTALQLFDFSECAYTMKCEYKLRRKTAYNTTTGEGVQVIFYDNTGLDDLFFVKQTRPQEKAATCAAAEYDELEIEGSFSYTFRRLMSDDEKVLKSSIRSYYYPGPVFTNELCVRITDVKITLQFSSISNYEVVDNAPHMEIVEDLIL